MAEWKDITGPVIGESTYAGGKLVARDIAITLPEITSVTADYQLGGTVSLPVTAQIDNMESSLTYIGIDYGIVELIKQGKLEIEHRFVLDKADANGDIKQIGCKAYLSLIPQGIPALEITVGEPMENEITYTALRYRLVVNGEEVLNIDKIARKFVVGGKDYYQSIDSML